MIFNPLKNYITILILISMAFWRSTAAFRNHRYNMAQSGSKIKKEPCVTWITARPEYYSTKNCVHLKATGAVKQTLPSVCRLMPIRTKWMEKINLMLVCGICGKLYATWKLVIKIVCGLMPFIKNSVQPESH